MTSPSGGALGPPFHANVSGRGASRGPRSIEYATKKRYASRDERDKPNAMSAQFGRGGAAALRMNSATFTLTCKCARGSVYIAWPPG